MDTQPMRYRGFISYSQRDKPIARRLHRALETYRIPKGVEAAWANPFSRTFLPGRR